MSECREHLLFWKFLDLAWCTAARFALVAFLTLHSFKLWPKQRITGAHYGGFDGKEYPLALEIMVSTGWKLKSAYLLWNQSQGSGRTTVLNHFRIYKLCKSWPPLDVLF